MSFACVCGTRYPTVRWLWVDAETRPDLARRSRERGPFEGSCPSCGRAAFGQASWLLVHPRKRKATFVLGEHLRGDYLRVLRDHIDELIKNPEFVTDFLLAPAWEFVAAEEIEEDTNPGRRIPAKKLVPKRRESEMPDMAKLAALADKAERPSAKARDLTQPDAVEVDDLDLVEDLAVDLGEDELDVEMGDEVEIIEPKKPAALGGLEFLNGVVTAEVELDSVTAEFWKVAQVKVRPVLVRDCGYPLLLVRFVGNIEDERAVIDCVADISSETTGGIFATLAQEFSVDLQIVSQVGETIVQRQVRGHDLERNAAMCFEGARGYDLSGGPRAFREATKLFGKRDLKRRLKGAKAPLDPEDYQNLSRPSRVWKAMEALNDGSKKENLSFLLEACGLSITAYESLRASVLSACESFGLCPPSRFWRRALGASSAGDYAEWAGVLAKARARTIDSGRDDLNREQSGEAWHRIRDLCTKKKVDEPAELISVLGTRGSRSAVPRMRRSNQAPVAASGFIGDDAPAKKAAPKGVFHASKNRLAKATEMLAKAKTPEAVGRVLDALEEFDIGDLLAILPTISELGYQAVPALIERLSAPRREVRQSVAILLGLANDARALDALCQRLIVEDTTIWTDIARAVGSFGPRAIGPLSELLQDVPASKLDFTVARCGRAMAEVIISDGDDEAGPGRVAIESMIDVTDAALSAAAREALGTLRDVKSASEMVRGERPLNEDTAIRGFSRRAYEAIMVPEIDLLVDVEELDEISG